MSGFMILVCICAGVFSIFCALKDYDFFMESRKAVLFVKILGRNGARVFYVLLGIFLIVFAAYMHATAVAKG